MKSKFLIKKIVFLNKFHTKNLFILICTVDLLENRYIKVKDISQGAQGVITLMKDTKDNNKYVILKRIKTSDESRIDFQKSFNEVNLLKQLHHPNIIQYYNSIYEPPEKLYIFLEYADGQDLAKYIKKNHKMSTNQILNIFSQIIFGLSYIHSKKIIHRDLKCENIFLFKNELVKIGDFGVSKEISDNEQFTKTIIGSPLFFAPEILLNMPYSYPADIWAVGCILYQMMTGKHPFSSKSHHQLVGKVLSGNVKMPSGCDKRLVDLFLEMVNQEPKDRPTAAQILEMPMIKEQLSKLQKNIDLNMITSRNSKGHKSYSIDGNEINQYDVPDWIKDNQDIANEFLFQSNRKLEQDTSSFAELIKSTLADINQKNTPLMITNNLSLRKENLIQQCKLQLKENYTITYDFIKKNGIDKRNELYSILNTTLPEKLIKMIETITMIERFQ